MSLASAITTAQTIFSNTGHQTAVVSQNIANSGNADYVRRLAMMGVDSNGSYFVRIERAQNDALFKQNMNNIAGASAQSRLTDGLQSLQNLYGGSTYSTSPATYLTSFQTAIQTFAASPGNSSIASSAVSAAGDLANALKNTSAALQSTRSDIDKEIRDQVSDLNGYLKQFEGINNEIIGAVATGRDASDALDQRDKLLKGMASIVGISTVTRSNMDTVIYSTDGSVLFETSARTVTFTATDTYDATTPIDGTAANAGVPKPGGAISIDGVKLKPGSGGNTTGQGTLTSLLQLRDGVIPTMQLQLDEIARGLITTFAQSGQPGLFKWGNNNPLPVTGTPTLGIAASLYVDPLAKANPLMLRDGGFNGATSQNPTQSAGYTVLLNGYLKALNEPLPFDTDAGLTGTATLAGYTAESIGWLEQLRKAAASSAESKDANLTQTSQALSNKTGVSLDEELALMLDLEQSYKASAKLLSTVDEMLRTLLDTVR